MKIFYITMAVMMAYVIVYCLACYRAYFRTERPAVKRSLTVEPLYRQNGSVPAGNAL